MLKYGVGGINIDECRVGQEERTYKGMSKHVPDGACTFRDDNRIPNDIEVTVNGRFPANLILTYDDTDYEEVCGGFPDSKSVSSIGVKRSARSNDTVFDSKNCGLQNTEYNPDKVEGYSDEGSASRYFYCAKASRRDRDDGLENIKNIHPTVKPISLMQYLVRLVTPKGGRVLDCFMGSGSTGKACMYENKDRNANYYFVGIEMTKEYLPICQGRIDYAINNEITVYDENQEEQQATEEKQTKVELW